MIRDRAIREEGYDPVRHPRHFPRGLLVAVLVLACFPRAVASEAEDAITRARRFLQNDEAEKAIAVATEVIQQEQGKGNEKAYLIRARAYAQAGQRDVALSDYDRALEIDPKSQEAHAERGDLHFKNGDLSKAMADYAELRTGQGEIGAAQRQRDYEAIQTEAYPTGNGRNPTEVFLEAERMSDSGRIREAVQLYNEVLGLTISPQRSAIALRNRGNSYDHLGNRAQAKADYDLALRYDPSNASVYFNRGLLLESEGDTAGAIQDYTEAVRLDPKLIRAFFRRAEAFWLENDAEGALQDLGRAIALDENWAPPYTLRGAIFLQQGRLDLALAALNQAIAGQSTPVQAFTLRAHVFGRISAYERKRADLETAIRVNRAPFSEALNMLAWLRATCPRKSLRNGKKAIAEALECCEMTEWARGGYVDTLAAAYAENGEFEKAADFQLYALSLPDFPPDARSEAEARLRLYKNRRPYRDKPLKPPAE